MTEQKRTVPVSLEAERGVLGSMLLDPVSAIGKVSLSGLKADAFYDQRNQHVFDVMMEMTSRGIGLDALLVGEELKRRKMIDQIGGFDYLVQLQDTTVVSAHVNHYCELVREASQKRKIIIAANELVCEAYKETSKAVELIQSVPGRFTGMLNTAMQPLSNLQVLDTWFDRMEKIKRGEIENGLPLPWPVLDTILGGLEPGLIIIGARPSAGKTTMEVNICDHLARHGIAVARACLDMSREALLVRSVIRESRVSLPKLKKGWARRNQMETVRACKNLVSSWPMHIIEDRTLESIVAKARALKLRYDIRLLTVDFVQLVHLEKGSRERRLEIGIITSTLKALAFELNIPVILLSQLGRESDKENRRPKLSDLRESGDLEQDATQVILLSKATEKMLPELVPPDIERRLLRPVLAEVAKNQNGEIGDCPLYMAPNYFRFDEAESNWLDLKGKMQEFQYQYNQDECAKEDVVVDDGALTPESKWAKAAGSDQIDLEL